MKYLLFSIAVMGLPALILALTYLPKLRDYAVTAMPALIVVFNQCAINFFSHEDYRGTARGMEISLIYLLAIAVLGSYLLRNGGSFKLLPDLGSKIYWIYFLFCLPSLSNAESKLFGFFELWKMAMLYLVFLAMYHYMYHRRDPKAIINGFSIVVIYNFLTVVRQHFQGYHQTPGSFPHQNSMAMFMTCLGTLLFAKFYNSNDRRERLISLVLFGLAGVSVVRTYSRGAILCFPLACGLTLLVSLIQNFSHRKLRILIPLSFLGIIVVLMFLPKIINRFVTAPESSGQTRKNFAIAALNMIRHKPVAGVGINNWGIKINPPYEYSEHRDPSKGFTEDYKDGIVETIYLLVAAECGIPALFLLLLWFANYWFKSLMLLPKLKATEFFYLPAGIIGGLTGIYMQSTLEWVLKQQVNFIELLTLFAIIGCLSKTPLTDKTKTKIKHQTQGVVADEKQHRRNRWRYKLSVGNFPADCFHA